MGIAQIVYPADIAKQPEPHECECHHHHHPCPPPPPDPKHGIWIVPAPPPAGYPPYPYPPMPPVPPVDDDSSDDIKIKTKSIEAQICKLSKKSAAIKAMIQNFEEKNKDAIIKIGGTSYNFGPYKNIFKEGVTEYEEVTEYGEIILEELLKAELEKIKEKLQELAAELDDEDLEG